MAEFFSVLFDNIRILRISDFIDVAIVAFVIYKGINLIRETRASQLIKGIVGKHPPDRSYCDSHYVSARAQTCS